jgi:tetratricopeptide (TPR) repeat protein
VTTQYLAPEDGDEKSALDSVHAIFPLTRDILRRPGNAGWQRDLAVAYSRVGAVLEAQGQLSDAQTAFAESLAIGRRLAEKAPSNATRQRDLAMACLRLAHAEAKTSKFKAALKLYEESLRIFAGLVARAPGFQLSGCSSGDSRYPFRVFALAKAFAP